MPSDPNKLIAELVDDLMPVRAMRARDGLADAPGLGRHQRILTGSAERRADEGDGQRESARQGRRDSPDRPGRHDPFPHAFPRSARSASSPSAPARYWACSFARGAFNSTKSGRPSWRERVTAAVERTEARA